MNKLTKLIFILFTVMIPSLCYANNADTLKVKQHLTYITKTPKARNYNNLDMLNHIAGYIFNQFEQYADTVYYQPYKVKGVEYKNVVAVFGSENARTIVIGAHYDVCGNQEGADDNASGTVGLLELARLLQGKELKHRIELVAYTLEEPPFFRSEWMGSYIHASSLKEANTDVYGMVCLEMIAYFDSRDNTQDYPVGMLSWFYGNKGDYITLVNKFGKGTFASRFTRKFKKVTNIKTKEFSGPKSLPGIDFSDHLNYWKLGYSAVMITDTAFYRNKNYHEKTDTMATLDIPKMTQVIDAVYQTVLSMK